MALTSFELALTRTFSMDTCCKIGISRKTPSDSFLPETTSAMTVIFSLTVKTIVGTLSDDGEHMRVDDPRLLRARRMRRAVAGASNPTGTQENRFVSLRSQSTFVCTSIGTETSFVVLLVAWFL